MAQNDSTNKSGGAFGLFQKMLGVLSKYGFGQIIKALILVFIAGYIIFFATNPEYLIDKTLSIIEKREQAEQRDSQEAIERRLQANNEIRRMLSELLYQTGADRTWIIEVHNGTHNLASGLPFLYGSMLMEETKEGVKKIFDDYEDFSLSKYAFASTVLDKGYYYGDTESLRGIDERIYYNLKFNDVNQLALMVLYNGDTPLGCLGISWCGDNRMEPEKAGRLIREFGTKIAVELLK